MRIDPAELAFDSEGTPYSPAYGDVYHSAESGPGQARHVFLGGNELPRRWAHTRVFTITRDRIRTGAEFPRHLARMARRSCALRATALCFHREAPVRACCAGRAAPALRRIRIAGARAAGRVAAAGCGNAPPAFRGRPAHTDACVRRRSCTCAAAAVARRRRLPRWFRTPAQPGNVVAAADAALGANDASRRYRCNLFQRGLGAPGAGGSRIRHAKISRLRAQARNAVRQLCAA